ncbi:3-dehydrosphinganine reductase [Neopestalotiopsis sp. 37M]|nr:3-dehydrosphinganine reductase [Neopestalotiopsis sp. 37M]
MGLFDQNHMPVEGRTILLTGASEGAGLSAARIFSRKGANLVLVSRDMVKLEAALESIESVAKSPDTQRFHAIAADVGKPNYAEKVVADAVAWNNGQPPEIVWCLAGLSTPMLWTDDGAMDAARHNMDVNYFGSAELSRAMMRAWLSNPKKPRNSSSTSPHHATKHIIFTGTILSTFAIAGHATYCPSKFAVRALADALAMEVRLYPDVPMEVHLVLPQSINTAGYERENETKPQITKELEGVDTPQGADEVARLAIAGIENGHYFVTTSLLGDLCRWGAMSNSPRNNWLLDTIMGWIAPFIWALVMWDMNSRVSAWGRKRSARQ